MTKYFLLCLTILICINSVAQTHSETFTVCGNSYTASCNLDVDNSIKLGIKKATDDTMSEIKIKTNDLELFARSFKQHFLAFAADDSSKCSREEKDNFLLSYGRKLYIGFIAASTIDSLIPTAGTMKIKGELPVYAKPSGSSQYEISAEKYKVLKVQVEINEGYIENIKAYVQIHGKTFYFLNNYAIGFSSIINYQRLDSIKLYELYSDPYSKPKGANRTFFYIKLNNLIDYDYDLEVDRKDYSPQNIKFVVLGGESVVLYKQTTKKLFEAKVFTDFVGLNEDKPNGLVQTEITKRINIKTVQHLTKPWLYWLFKSYGGLQYIAPAITISKLEQHNKRLVLGDLDSVRLNPGPNDTSTFKGEPHRYTSALELYRYQSFSAGLDINLYFFSNRNLKFNLYINAGVRLGITQVSDSITSVDQGSITKTGFVNEYSVNTIQYYPEIILQFLPEERFNLSISDKFLHLQELNNNIQLMSFEKNNNAKLLSTPNRWLNIFELLMTIQVNENSKLFGRLRFNSELNNSKNNFAQIQLGYSFYILGNK